jgi:hypothetical protein
MTNSHHQLLEIAKTLTALKMSEMPIKYIPNRITWVTQAIFTYYLSAFGVKMSSQNGKISLFVDQCAVHPHNISYLKI